jgi:hypothetical protein
MAPSEKPLVAGDQIIYYGDMTVEERVAADKTTATDLVSR